MKSQSDTDAASKQEKGQAEPQSTTNKQAPNNECVHSGAGLNVSDSLVLQEVWPPTDLTHCLQLQTEFVSLRADRAGM